jgi:multicomponent Na+:H+ antiporter subunit D
MTTHIIIFPILIQLCIALLLLFLWSKPNVQRMVSIIGSTLSLVIAIFLFRSIWTGGIQSMQLGNWSAPFGISLVADTLSVTMVLLTNIVALAVSIYSSSNIVASRVKFGYFAIFHFMIMGLSGAFLTGDLFNLYVWFEVVLISSFVLLTIGGKRIQIEGAVKYFTLNLLASVIFLTGIGLLYGLTGSLNLAELATIIPYIEAPELLTTIALIFFIGFGVKAGVFPLYFWLPAAYHTPPAAISALFGGLLTKLGVYAIIRVFTLVFPMTVLTHDLITTVGILTIVFGGLGAYLQKDLIRTFAYFIICHIGFMVVGIGMKSELALSGSVFYMFHDIIVKTTLFMIAGVVLKINGTTNLDKTGGLMQSHPRLSVLFAISLFTLVGIPPLSGFWPKLSLLQASLYTANFAVLGAIIFGSFITLVVIARVWNNVFARKSFKAPPLKDFRYFTDYTMREKITLISPIALLVLVSLYIGLGAEHISTLAQRIANELIYIQPYCEAVLTNSGM